MTVYNLVSSILSYVFTTIIYLFIFGVIGLIYMDVRKMNGYDVKIGAEESDEDEIEDGENTAILRTIKSAAAAEYKMRKCYRIGEEQTVIGRDENCEIVIANKYLSLEHFRIWYEDDAWLIEDLGSRNGTTVNGEKLYKVMELEDGDEISFGGLQLIFEIEQR